MIPFVSRVAVCTLGAWGSVSEELAMLGDDGFIDGDFLKMGGCLWQTRRLPIRRLRGIFPYDTERV